MKVKYWVVLLALGLIRSPFAEANVRSASAAYFQTNNPGDTTSTKKAPENWFNLDVSESKVTGVSTEKAYMLLQGKPSRTVVVGVIDSGIDIEHEDLKDNIWVNEKEIPGNGIDDDNNGYVDDVHGWNFIGGKDGKHVDHDTYELTREYVKLKNRFEGDKAKKFRRKDKEGYQNYLSIKQEFESKVDDMKKQYAGVKSFYDMYKPASDAMKAHLGKTKLTAEDVEAVESGDEKIAKARAILLYAFSNGIDEAGLNDYVEYLENGLQYGYNTEFDPRSIVGDKYDDLNDRNYGNNDVAGPDPKHGTHVAGIIGAVRDNGIGMKGIADNVKIMVLRAVPNGDERDKDIANAIRYAVDNGAQIINMSFGKAYSPNKPAVDEAVKYAASKGVLLVHAAGNDSKNVDEENNFPNRKFFKSNKVASNWLEVGASSWGDSTNFVGNFSNYGKQSVDVFAPGVDIYSTTPGQKYEHLSGTSMAAPVTTGIAALLMSYYPDLSAEQVKDIIIKSSVKYTGVRVNMPGAEDKSTMVAFEDLSNTGGVANAYEAVKLAEQLSKSAK